MKRITLTLLASAVALGLCPPVLAVGADSGSRETRVLIESKSRGDRPPPPGRADPRPGRDHPPRPPGRGGDHPPGHGGPRPEPPDRPDRPDPDDASGRNGARSPCPAGSNQPQGPAGQAGRSHIAHLRLEAAGTDAAEPARARMSYRWIGPSLVVRLQAMGLAADASHALVALAADGSAICLGEGVSNPAGNLQLSVNLDPESHLPPDLDPFTAPDADDPEADATVLLLPADDVDCATGAIEAGDDGLVSDRGLRFVDTDELVCE